MDVSKPETGTPFGPVKQIEAGVLDNGYVEAGPADGPAVVLLHAAGRGGPPGYRPVRPRLRDHPLSVRRHDP